MTDRDPSRSCSPARERRDRTPLILALALALLVAAPVARAHALYECWATALLYPDRLEIVLSMNQLTALRIVDPHKQIPAITEKNFATHRALLERAAAEFYVVAANRKPLKPVKVEVKLTEDIDLDFKLVFPLPPPGTLRFENIFFAKLGDGYSGILDIGYADGPQLGWEQVSWSYPNFEVTVPVKRPQTK